MGLIPIRGNALVNFMGNTSEIENCQDVKTGRFSGARRNSRAANLIDEGDFTRCSCKVNGFSSCEKITGRKPMQYKRERKKIIQLPMLKSHAALRDTAGPRSSFLPQRLAFREFPTSSVFVIFCRERSCMVPASKKCRRRRRLRPQRRTPLRLVS